MLEKQARIKVAAATLKQSIFAVAQENTENLKIASHNEQVRLTGKGERKPYQKAAFSRMIKAADSLSTDAVTE